MRNRVKLLLVFSCVLWIACGLFYRTQTIDASSKIPDRYKFTKICDNGDMPCMNNEGTVLVYKDQFLATGNGGQLTELIKIGDIVFSEWYVDRIYSGWIDDKGLTWVWMHMHKAKSLIILITWL